MIFHYESFPPWPSSRITKWGHFMSLKIIYILLNILYVNVAINQEYQMRVDDEYVIKGNDVLLKCKIPSFVADLVKVVSWEDQDQNSYSPNQHVHGNCSRGGSSVFILFHIQSSLSNSNKGQLLSLVGSFIILSNNFGVFCASYQPRISNSGWRWICYTGKWCSA